MVVSSKLLNKHIEERLHRQFKHLQLQKRPNREEVRVIYKIIIVPKMYTNNPLFPITPRTTITLKYADSYFNWVNLLYFI